MRTRNVIPFGLAILAEDPELIGYRDGGPRDRTTDSPFVDSRPGDVGCVHDLRVYHPPFDYDAWLRVRQRGEAQPTEIAIEAPFGISAIEAHMRLVTRETGLTIGQQHALCLLPFNFGANGEAEHE